MVLVAAIFAVQVKDEDENNDDLRWTTNTSSGSDDDDFKPGEGGGRAAVVVPAQRPPLKMPSVDYAGEDSPSIEDTEPKIEGKFNANHDEQGRFASEAGGANSLGVGWMFSGESQAITAAAAALCKDPGEFYPDDSSPSDLKQAGELMDAVNAEPRYHATLYSGHVRGAGENRYKTGDEMTIPLMAASGSQKLASAYATVNANADPDKDPVVQGAIEHLGQEEGLAWIRQVGGAGGQRYPEPGSQATIFKFASGTRAPYYRENERLVSGRFKVEGVEYHPLAGHGQYLDESGFHPIMQRTVSLRYLGPAERVPPPSDDDDYDTQGRWYGEEDEPKWFLDIQTKMGWENEERGQGGRWMSGSGFVSKAAYQKVQKQAEAKAKAAPKPTRAEIAHNRELLAHSTRHGGELRGNSYARHARTAKLLSEFGDGKHCPCVYCGRRLDASTLTQDKIYTAEQGGRYHMNNLLPACLGCNQSRGDNKVAA